MRFEQFTEIILIFVAQRIGNLFDALVRDFQELLRFLHLQPCDVFNEILTGFPFEQATQITWMQVQMRRNVFERYFLIEMIVNEPLAFQNLAVVRLSVHLPSPLNRLMKVILEP